jgi:hypothetical protein
MLARVRAFWIDGVLEQSLHGAALLELGMVTAPQAVERAWDAVVQLLNERSLSRKLLIGGIAAGVGATATATAVSRMRSNGAMSRACMCAKAACSADEE